MNTKISTEMKEKPPSKQSSFSHIADYQPDTQMSFKLRSPCIAIFKYISLNLKSPIEGEFFFTLE